MEILMPGKIMLLEDVPAGGVVGFFDEGQYVRFLRTASENKTHVTAVSLGPFYDRNYDAHVQGPTSYFLEADTQVVFEEKTVIAPKLDTALDPAARYLEIGSIVWLKSGQLCLLCRSSRGQRALIDLSNGEVVRSENAVVLYKDYVLLLPNESEKMRVTFDSSKKSSNIATAA
jgi:hypothetical protein